jgi:hypothetical protein
MSATIADAEGKPVVVLRGSGGWSDRIEQALYEGQYLDERKTVAVAFADSPEEAAAIAFAAAKAGSSPGRHI